MASLTDTLRSPRIFGPESGQEGIAQVIGPEMGLTQPGMTITCGHSHTSTHGAFGAIVFGTSQVRDLLARRVGGIEWYCPRRISYRYRWPRGEDSPSQTFSGATSTMSLTSSD